MLPFATMECTNRICLEGFRYHNDNGDKLFSIRQFILPRRQLSVTYFQKIRSLIRYFLKIFSYNYRLFYLRYLLSIDQRINFFYRFQRYFPTKRLLRNFFASKRKKSYIKVIKINTYSLSFSNNIWMSKPEEMFITVLWCIFLSQQND